MAIDPKERESYFPIIEKKYGQPMSYWFAVMSDMAERKYPEQIAFLKEEHGFTQAHANALVMFSRGSTSTMRFKTPDEYFKAAGPKKAKTMRAIFAAIGEKYPDLELAVAWNQPMLRIGKTYIFGLSHATNHILMAPWSRDVIDAFRPKLKDYTVNLKTIEVPVDWDVDAKLLQALVKARLAEIK
jgi:uncharacterized protein YdhG (YjbR/CyaY superfamily)